EAVPLHARLVLVGDRLPALSGIALDVRPDVQPVLLGFDLLELVHSGFLLCGDRVQGSGSAGSTQDAASSDSGAMAAMCSGTGAAFGATAVTALLMGDDSQ